jgi:WD40 repeat protein
MAGPQSLDDLVSRWHDSRQKGQTLSAEELCAGSPEKLADLKQRLEAVASMMSLLGLQSNSSPAAAAVSESDTLPPPAASPVEEPGASRQTLLQSPQMQPRAVQLSKDGPGVVIKGYEVLRELGRGGMGVVYQARHLRLNRVVALKMILAGSHAGEQDLLRFLGEAEAVGALQHPHIVQLFDFGQHQGLPYFTLEFVSGGSLADKLQGTPLTPREAARVVEQLARGMAYAHERGIVHRDLKPQNVLLAEDGTPKITDFGLAKRVEVGTGLTATGAVMGTPSYMAPEQAGGKSKQVGPPADIYALGAILYECLTGRPPFRAATLHETLSQVVRDEPAAVRQLQPGVPADLQTICHKCLQKEPGKRYASAADLAEDLRRFQAGDSIQARPVGRLERSWKWARRTPAVAVSVVAVTLSLLAATVVSAIFGLRAEQARQAEAEHALSEATAKQEADRARRDAQRQLLDLCGASGLAAAKENDHSLALLWFARAVQLAKDEPQQEELNRIRVANWLRQVCLPEGTFTIAGFQQKQDRFRTLQFSPDGKYLLVLASTGDCLLWDRPRGHLVQLPEPAGQGSAAAWQPESGLLAVGGREGPIRLLAAPEFRPVGEVPVDGDVAALAFSRDGRRLAWGGSGGARVWDLGKKEYVTPLLPHPQPVASVSFGAAGDLLATSARDLKARVFRVDREAREPLFPPVPHWLAEYKDFGHGGPDRVAPRFAADDQVVLTVQGVAQGGYALLRRSARNGQLLSSSGVPPNEKYLLAFAVSPQGNQAVALWGNAGRLVDLRGSGILAALPSGGDRYENATFAPDGKTLVTCGTDGSVRFWSLDERPDYVLTAAASSIWHPTQVVSVALSLDGQHLAAALWDGRVCLWRLPKGPPTGYSLPIGWGSLAALSPDGRFVVPRGVSYRNGTLLGTQVYDAVSGKAAGPSLDPGGILLDAAFSSDGTRVATASSTARTQAERNQRLFEPEGKGGNVQVWDWRTGKLLVGPIPMPGEPRGLAFRPDGRTLAAVCADYHVLLIDPGRGNHS